MEKFTNAEIDIIMDAFDLWDLKNKSHVALHKSMFASLPYTELLRKHRQTQLILSVLEKLKKQVHESFQDRQLEKLKKQVISA